MWQFRVRSVLFAVAGLLYLIGALGALGLFGGVFGSRVPGLFASFALATGLALGIPPQSQRDRERRLQNGLTDPLSD